MRKTDKKIDNQICKILTDVCETALEKFDGFQWLTHLVNYSNFPNSLQVVCVFDTQENLERFMLSPHRDTMVKLIQVKLFEADVVINNSASQIVFRCEEKQTEQKQRKRVEH